MTPPPKRAGRGTAGLDDELRQLRRARVARDHADDPPKPAAATYTAPQVDNKKPLLPGGGTVICRRVWWRRLLDWFR